MALQKIEDIDGLPVVGKHYLVRCVHTNRLTGMPLPLWDKWMPINGPLHEDAEYIGFGAWHYHYDFRFFTKKQMSVYDGCIPGQHHASVMTMYDKNWSGPGADYRNLPVVYRPKQCIRQMTEFPWHIDFLQKLEPAFVGCRLKAGHICPHKGISLKGLPLYNGLLVCPGHGLAFRPATGTCVGRVDIFHTKLEEELKKALKYGW